MLAYSKTTLGNLAIHQQVEEAVHRGIIPAEKEKEIKLAYPVDLYTPNFFVRIGLGILTVIIVVASLGLLALLTNFNNAGIVLLISALVFYGFLEMMVVGKKHYNSGVDNLLMITVLILFTAAIMDFLPYTINDDVIGSLCIFLASFYFTLRFADSLMGIIASTALLLFIFYSISTPGMQARLFLPFIMIAASGLLYFLAVKIASLKSAMYYSFTLKAIMIVALVGLYTAGNYFVVRELSVEMFKYTVAKNGHLQMAWFFWLWTMVIPIIYIGIGLKKRDLVFVRLGIIASVFAVLTFRYYYAVLAAEVAMLLAGTLIIIIACVLIKYLRQPHHGFTFDDTNKKKVNTLNLEGLVVGEVFGNTATPQDQGMRFGGGNFGGAGAGDNY